ncbi:signal peptidase I [Antarctobacter heliothermus]|uniref:Signal peptidase I n=1 Tax=Antarctobacter heliothermus TaxID=74033 RepID=A0A222DYL7_9RHOB|nr:signal peptidase I [Antarctobacter heliothermus]ASP18801.1 signal peptidase I [Antarctobacter heliothermus]MBT54379.1 signal peptidase I [Mameliella sp.]|tara:strand:- start:39616 stop:40449 length:834 start_codon:yes stop_codon:yes gene_type:complete
MATEEKKGGLWETIKTIVYALLIAGVFRTLLFQPFWIPSGSMKDTLLIGDFLFVNKMAYGYSYASCPSVIIPSVGINVDAQDLCGWADGDNARLFGGEPQRGDVVVFRHPVSGRDFIKRLIGLPGERIQMRNGVLHIDGQPVEVTPDGTFEELAAPQGPQGLRPRCANGTVGDGATCHKEKLIETLPGGVSHSILNISMQGSDNTPVYTVPEGHYFFMGDNRDNSSDSRVPSIANGVGFVPYENLIGRADRVMFSSAGRSMLYFWTWRSDRFFEKIE